MEVRALGRRVIPFIFPTQDQHRMSSDTRQMSAVMLSEP